MRARLCKEPQRPPVSTANCTRWQRARQLLSASLSETEIHASKARVAGNSCSLSPPEVQAPNLSSKLRSPPPNSPCFLKQNFPLFKRQEMNKNVRTTPQEGESHTKDAPGGVEKRRNKIHPSNLKPPEFVNSRNPTFSSCPTLNQAKHGSKKNKTLLDWIPFKSRLKTFKPFFELPPLRLQKSLCLFSKGRSRVHCYR